MLFFQTHNARPLLGCKVEGWHHETRHRRRRERDANGNEREVVETYVVRVSDFEYKVDLSSFIFPYGYMASVDEKGLNVPQLLDKYLHDSNMLKSLEMRKVVQFDFDSLHAMVYGYLRSLGWRRGLTISFPKARARRSARMRARMRPPAVPSRSGAATQDPRCGHQGGGCFGVRGQANHTVRVYSSNALSDMWENCFCKFLCHVTIVPVPSQDLEP